MDIIPLPETEQPPRPTIQEKFFGRNLLYIGLIALGINIVIPLVTSGIFFSNSSFSNFIPELFVYSIGFILIGAVFLLESTKIAKIENTSLIKSFTAVSIATLISKFIGLCLSLLPNFRSTGMTRGFSFVFASFVLIFIIKYFFQTSYKKAIFALVLSVVFIGIIGAIFLILLFRSWH